MIDPFPHNPNIGCRDYLKPICTICGHVGEHVDGCPHKERAEPEARPLQLPREQEIT